MDNEPLRKSVALGIKRLEAVHLLLGTIGLLFLSIFIFGLSVNQEGLVLSFFQKRILIKFMCT